MHSKTPLHVSRSLCQPSQFLGEFLSTYQRNQITLREEGGSKECSRTFGLDSYHPEGQGVQFRGMRDDRGERGMVGLGCFQDLCTILQERYGGQGVEPWDSEPALSFSLGLSSKAGFSATYLLCDLGQVIYLSEPQSPYLYKGTVMMPVLVPLNCPLELLGKK